MAALVPHLFNGLTLGLLFALIALGFTLIVGVMEVINLAHGSLFALGAYFGLTIRFQFYYMNKYLYYIPENILCIVLILCYCLLAVYFIVFLA